METGVCESILPVWVEYLKAVGPMIIGLAVTYVAWMQWHVNNNRLKHELFDRRYRVFEATRIFIGKVASSGRAKGEVILEFKLNTIESEFLFGKDISNYLDKAGVSRCVAVSMTTTRPVYPSTLQTAGSTASAAMPRAGMCWPFT